MTENEFAPPASAPVAEPPQNKMQKQLIIIGVLLTLAIIGLVIIKIFYKPAEQIKPSANQISQFNMLLTSQSFKNDGYIPAKYTCDGTNINPPLKIFVVPENAVSLALIVDDPDAPAGDWVHWLVWNIDPSTQIVEENSVPTGAVQGLTDFARNEYGGPCPPSGTHRYQFKLYALDTALNLPPTSKKSDLINAIQGHVLSETKLTGLYNR